VNVVHSTVRDVNEAGDAATQVQKRMHLDGAARSLIWRPRAERKTDVDGRRVQCVDGIVEFYTEIVAGVQRASDPNEGLSQIGIDAPVASLISVGQSGSRHRMMKSEVIKFAGYGTQAGFQVPQALAMRQLRECHTEPLVPTREMANVPVRLVACDAALKLAVRNKVHQPRENHPALVHTSI